MGEVEGARYDRSKSAGDLNLLLELDEPVLLMTELKHAAARLAELPSTSGDWRLVAEWAAEAEVKLAKQQEPRPKDSIAESST
jgi:hypothetical protein